MTVQTLDLTAMGIGAAGDPALEAGVHLRWQFDPTKLAFSPQGFTVYRRLHQPGDPIELPLVGLTFIDVTSADIALLHLQASAPMSTELDATLGWSIRLAAGTTLTITGMGLLFRDFRLDEVHKGDPLVATAIDQGVIVGLALEDAPATRNRLVLRADRFDGVVIEAHSDAHVLPRQYVPATQVGGNWVGIASLGLPTGWADAAPRLPVADRARVHHGYENVQDLIDDLGSGSQTIVSGDQAFILDPFSLLLGFSIDPLAARILGLYYADTTAVSGTSYDYRIVGNWGEAREYVCYGLTPDQAPPLHAPTGLTAASVQRSSGLFRDVSQGPQMGVDLSWTLPAAADTLHPGAPVAYHVTRKQLTDTGWSAGVRLTRKKPIIPGAIGGTTPATLFRDVGIADGRYRYSIVGLDLFGRESPPSKEVEIEVADVRAPPPPSDLTAEAAASVTGDVSLQASWRWTPHLRRQAPDAAEFRVLYETRDVQANVDRTDAADWQGVFATMPVGSDDRHVLPSTPWFPLATSLAVPVAYALVGVCTVDSDGNVGPVSAPVTIALRRQVKPAAPTYAPPAGTVYATAADYLGRSRVSITWASDDSDLLYDVYRASDLALFSAAEAALGAGFSRADYASDEALLALALDARVTAAFTRVTVIPISGGKGAVLSYVDVFDGRSSRRALGSARVEARQVYRVLAADRAGNRSDLSAAAVVVRIRDVSPPGRPAVTRVSAGPAAVTIEWQKNRDADLDGYRLYRADRQDDATDTRRMTTVATFTANDPRLASPAAGRLSYTDSVTPLGDVWYRLTALDLDANESAPTDARRGRAYTP